MAAPLYAHPVVAAMAAHLQVPRHKGMAAALSLRATAPSGAAATAAHMSAPCPFVASLAAMAAPLSAPCPFDANVAPALAIQHNHLMQAWRTTAQICPPLWLTLLRLCFVLRRAG